MNPLWQQIADHISEVSGEPFHPERETATGGGCINTTTRLSNGDRHYFVKLNQASRLEMFIAEEQGLKEIANSNTIRAPQPLCHGISGNQAYLAMEYIQLGRPQKQGPQLAGRQLADMHRCHQRQYGWERDNTIGSTHQSNRLDSNWIRFWREERLRFQLTLAADNGHGGRLQQRGEKLLAQLESFIDHDPAPSLLHGDLWGGNLGYDQAGNPVIYDPAVYYGDREADLAMTELFGGFPSTFYAAYQEAWPLDAGYGSRKKLYNLYHLLNHLNLFGTGYLGQSQDMIDQLLSECR